MLQAPVNAWFAEELSARSWFHRDSATGNKIYSYASEGGAKIGGIGSALIRNPNFPYTGSGGAKFSGTADALKRESILLYGATGGASASGSATANLIVPVIYYIDPFNGNDSNNATSWANAVRTFKPFADGTIPLQAAYRVYIAKTPDPIAHGTLTAALTFSSNLAGPGQHQAHRGGWPNSTTLLSTTDGYTNNVVVLDRLSTWTSFPDAKFTETNLRVSPYAATGKRLLWNYSSGTGYTPNMLIAYKTVNVTIPSGFTRLEARFGLTMVQTGTREGTAWTVTLCLCSDSAGQTTLLSLPLNHTATNSGIFVYEGTLPSATIGSIALRLTSQGTRAYHSFHFYSLIATKPITSVDYLGHFTEWKFGDHEGAFWTPTEAFDAGPVVALTLNYRGAASVNNTALTVRSRTAVGWDKFLHYPTGFTSISISNGSLGNYYTATSLYDYAPNLQVAEAAFFFKNKSGTASDPIEIVGGVDPNTNQVTGKTAILSGRLVFIVGDAYFTPLVFSNSSYITFKNIDIYNFIGTLLTYGGTNNGIRFENCELQYGPIFSSQWGNDGEGSPMVRLATTVTYDTASNDSFLPNVVRSFTNAYFKNCTGQFYLNGIHHNPSTFSASPPYLPNAVFSGFTMENCILTPHYGNNYPSLEGQYSYGLSYTPYITQANVVDTLKIYAVANDVPTATLANNVSTSQCIMYLPTFATAQNATVYVYGAGAIWASPVATDNQRIALYKFPKLFLENTVLIYSNARTARGKRGYYPNPSLSTSYVGGEADSLEFPEVTFALTPTAWSGTGSNRNFYFLIQPGPGTSYGILAHFKKVTVSGSSASASIPIYLLNYPSTSRSPVQISQVNTTGVTNNALAVLGVKFNAQDTSSDARSTKASSLIIIDGMTTHSIASASNINFFNGQITGHTDLRNVSYSITTGGRLFFNPSSSVLYDHSIYIRNSSVSPALQNLTNVASSPTSNTTQWYQPLGYDSGVVVLDSPSIQPVSSISTLTTSSTTEHSTSNSLIVPDHAITTIETSPSPSHKTYLSNGSTGIVIFEKDFTVKNQLSFSWKVTCKYRLISPYSLNLPLATLPVKAGKVVTITIYGRRSQATAYGGLMVYQNGCAGTVTPQDMQEFFVPISATQNTWQLLTCQFICQMSGVIDIAWSHFGIEGGNTWFEFLKVIEA